jgi:hypothetical protein
MLHELQTLTFPARKRMCGLSYVQLSAFKDGFSYADNYYDKDTRITKEQWEEIDKTISCY